MPNTRQCVQVDKTIVDGLKKIAKMNKRSMNQELEYILTQHITANITKVEQHAALDNVANAGNLKSNDK